AAGGPSPDSVWDFEEEVERLVFRGDDASVRKALELATPVLSGQLTFTEPSAPIQCLMLLPLARAGRYEEAAQAFQRARRAMYHGVYRYEYSAMRVEFCALTGNEKTGLSVLRENLAWFRTLNRPNGKMDYATAGAVLCRQLIAAGQGHEMVHANGSDLTWTVVGLHQELESIALELAAAFDARNGTTHQGDQIRARLAASPVVDFLPLTPTARRPDRSLAPPVGAPPEALLDRAEWHHAREEMTWGRGCLAVIGTPPPHLSARHAMLTALTDWDADDSGQRLAWAADALRQAGDLRRHLLCRCWLGSWLAEHNRVADGLPIVAWSVHELNRTDDHHAIAIGEWEYARALVRAGQDQNAYHAMARATKHAVSAGNPVLIGSIYRIEAIWREHDRFQPKQVLALAAAARDAYAAAGSPGQQVAAYEQMRRTHERAGTQGQFTEMVESELAALTPDAPARVRAYLRYRRAVALIEAGRAAEALEDMMEAVGEATSRDDDSATRSYHLAVAYHAAGRVEDAVQVADEIATWLDRLRERGMLDDPTMADANRLLLADGYAGLGDYSLALEEYEKVTSGAAERSDLATVRLAQTDAAAILDRLDRDAEAAQAYRTAGDAAEKLRDPYTLAACRAGEALSLHWTGNVERALGVLAEAERVTRKLPKKPAERLAASRAITLKSAAHVLAAAGRSQEAGDLTVQAADYYREVGNTVEAVKMDLLRGRILAVETPDLAIPVLRAALGAAVDIPPLHRLVARTLAATLDGMGQTDEAQRLRAGSA
ncbi:MAG: hypothetical protein ACRDP8_17265, partial [Actinopolymorphaceae bacterium]